MINIDSIESAAKAAGQYPFNTKRQSDHHWQTPPAAVLEMVSMIRERDAVLRQAMSAAKEAQDLFGCVETCSRNNFVQLAGEQAASLQMAIDSIGKVLEP